MVKVLRTVLAVAHPVEVGELLQHQSLGDLVHRLLPSEWCHHRSVLQVQVRCSLHGQWHSHLCSRE